jgi:hypothetical protein
MKPCKTRKPGDSGGEEEGLETELRNDLRFLMENKPKKK